MSSFLSQSVCLILCFVAMACSSNSDGGPASPVEIQNTKAYNVGPAAVFGDSVAFGTGANLVGSRPQACLSRLVGATNNFAENGATTQDAMGSLQDLLDSKPSVVLISLGGNDVLAALFGGGAIPESETLENLREIFSALTDAGSLVIHLGLNPPSNPLYPVDSSRLGKIKAVAQQEGVIFLENSFQGFWGNSSFMADDIHPNDNGYNILCDRVSQALEPHLI